MFGESEIGGDGLVVFDRSIVDDLMGAVGGGAGEVGVRRVPEDAAQGGCELLGDIDGGGEDILRLRAAIDGAKDVLGDGGEEGSFGVGASPDGDLGVMKHTGDDGAEEEDP